MMYRASKLLSIKDKLGFMLRSGAHGSKAVLTIEDMPKPFSLPFIGTKLELLAAGSGTRLHNYIDRRHQKLGPIFCERFSGQTDLVFVSDPDIIKSVFLNHEGKYPAHILPEAWVLYEKMYNSKRGLLFMDGEEWLQNRRIANRHLLWEDAEKWLQGPVADAIKNFIQSSRLRCTNESNFIPDLESEFYRLSIDVIVRVLLGDDYTMKKSLHYDELINMFSEAVKNIFKTTTKLYGVPVEWYCKLNLKAWRNFKDSVDTSLLLAQKMVHEMLDKNHQGSGLIKKLVEENLTTEMISRIVTDFIIAAGDTTAYTSLWTLYLISTNEKTMHEIREKENSFVKNVIKESMRLYPVAPFLTRILPNDCDIGSFLLSKGTPIVASIYTSGRDETNFSKANEFLPYRWDRNDPRKKDLKVHVPSASIPFALGARSCIGRKLAMIQLSELISQVAHNFNLKCLNNKEIEAVTTQVLVPKEPIKLLMTLKSY